MEHARLGLSNLRWPHCPGSVREEAKYPDIPGEAAIDGTGSHLLLDMCLSSDKNSADFIDQVFGADHPDRTCGWQADKDRVKRVQMCLDYVDRRVVELWRDYPGTDITVEAEQKTDPGGMFGRTDWWGTVDITIRCIGDGVVHYIEVIDYKDGRGYVDVNDNTQLLGGLAGQMRPHISSGPELARPFLPDRVGGCRMTIVQPKTNPVVRYDDSIIPSRVIERASELSMDAARTDREDAPLIPGKHCQWCKANPKRGGNCTAQAEKSLATVENMSAEVITINTDNTSLFEHVGKMIADPKALTAEQLADLADAEAGLLAAFQAVKDEIELRIEQGLQVPGYAMRPGRSSNVWADDEETVVKKLKGRRLKNADIYPAKLVSVPQILKSDKLTAEQKEKIEKDMVTRKAGKLGLTKVSREEASQAFVDIPKENVVQSSTNGIESVEQMFGDVPPSIPVDDKPETLISFF